MSERPSSPRKDVEAPLDIGMRLRAARAKLGMTRKQLVAASGTSERYLALLEAGDGNPTLSVLLALARALDMPPAALLPLEGERTPLLAQIVADVRKLPAEQLASLAAWFDSPRPAAAGGKAERVLLIGLRGAGKSTLGLMLANRLKVPFIEMSKRVEEAYGGDIGLLIELNGQAALRRYEAQAWEDICREHRQAVIAAPGGVVADPGLYARMLETAHTIWLRATPEAHMSRVMAQGDFRPMESNRAAMDDLKAILAARVGDYERAEVHVDTAAGPLEQVSARLHEHALALMQDNASPGLPQQNM